MRTNIIIDDTVMQAAMLAGNFKTKKDAVEAGLKLVARQAAYQRLRGLRGKVKWVEADEPHAQGARVAPNPLYAVHDSASETRRNWLTGV